MSNEHSIQVLQELSENAILRNSMGQSRSVLLLWAPLAGNRFSSFLGPTYILHRLIRSAST